MIDPQRKLQVEGAAKVDTHLFLMQFRRAFDPVMDDWAGVAWEATCHVAKLSAAEEDELRPFYVAALAAKTRRLLEESL